MLPYALLIPVKLDYVSISPVFSHYLDFINSPKELNLDAESLPIYDFCKIFNLLNVKNTLLFF